MGVNIGRVCKRADDMIISIILNSTEPAPVIAKKVGLSASSVRRYRIEAGYKYIHLGDAAKCQSYVCEVQRDNPDKVVINE